MTIVLYARDRGIYDSYYKVFENVIEVREIEQSIRFKTFDKKGYMIVMEVNKNEVERIVM